MAAAVLGVSLRSAGPADAGEILAAELLRLGTRCNVPAGLSGVGYMREDLPSLATGAFAQKRLVDNAPMAVDERKMEALLAGAMEWR
jgi:alcohol dehydrogenase class IV